LLALLPDLLLLLQFGLVWVTKEQLKQLHYQFANLEERLQVECLSSDAAISSQTLINGVKLVVWMESYLLRP